MTFIVVIISGILGFAIAVDNQFPPYFLFGAATSSYQVEGGWNASGKGESSWDYWVHNNPDTIADGGNGDVAADSYHRWEQDVAACVAMGLQFYRFSISWTRILPTGFSNNINEAGVEYYDNLIDKLRENNIEPMVTIFHWDMPQKLQELGGWTNPLMADWFASYAEVVFTLFADRVQYWITINEPAVICNFGYSPALAPRINERMVAPYLCNKHVLLAHAKAWRIYDEKFKPAYQGRVSLANHLVWFEPATEGLEGLAELAQEFLTGSFSHAIYSQEGGWPPTIEKFMADLSKRQGFNTSRLPPFTDEEKKLIRGTYDFYAMNHYTSRLVRRPHAGEEPGLWFLSGSPELDVIIEFDPTWEMGQSTTLATHPEGLRRQLAWVKDRYGDVEIIVTENGFSTGFGLIDRKRMEFIHDYLEQILLSIKVDNVNVRGYTYWSLLDNFEWMDGYSIKFGLYEVDFNDPNRPRIPRDSVGYYASVVKSKTLVDPAVYASRMQKTERYRRKEPNIENSSGRCYLNNHFIVSVALAVSLYIISMVV